MSAPGEELRLIHLEENSYFLETQVKSLDEQIAAQQKEIDELAKTVAQLKTGLMEIRALIADNRKGPADEPPPHHVPGLW